jgi:hypothetical protein
MPGENRNNKTLSMTMFLGLLKNDINFSILCITGLVLIGIYWFKYNLNLYFWLLLILWVMFIIFYYFKKATFALNIFVIIFVTLTITSGLFIFNKVPGLSISDTTSNAKKLVDCTGTASSPISQVSGWNTYMYAASPTGTSSTPDYAAKTTVKDSYSFAGLKNNDKVDNIYYYIELTDHSDLPSDYKRIMEVCDANNKVVASGSTHDTKTTNTGTKVVASYDWLLPYFINDKAVPGDFRVDGYLYVNGKWTLTNRIDKVHIIE